MRTWIVGLGVVSPLATGARETMRALMAGQRAQAKVTLFDASELRAQLAAEVTGLRIEDVAPRGEAARWSRSDALAVVAAREALIEGRVGAGAAVDLIVGGTTGGLSSSEGKIAAMHGAMRAGGEVAAAAIRAAAIDETLRSHPVSAAADRLFEAAHPFRRTRTLCSACSSGANAIALADAWIRAGKSSMVLAGGTDALCRLTYVGFNLLQAMDPAPCRPFDGQRAGMNLGEGAAFLLLESEASARARGVTPIAELAGWAIGSEAHHITNPEANGSTAARLMRAAVARGGLSLDDVGYVNAHGTATPHNDRMEAAALAEVFGARLSELPVSSSKGQIGHTLGAAGAIEAAITALALAGREVPPTAGLDEADPALAPMHHVRGVGVPLRARAALSSSFGFGGSNTVLALTEPELFAAPPRRAAAAARRTLAISAAATLGPEGLDASPGPAPGAARYLHGAPAENVATAAAESLAKSLDPDRGRRLDRAAALITALGARALRDAGLRAASPPAAATPPGAHGPPTKVDAASPTDPATLATPQIDAASPTNPATLATTDIDAARLGMVCGIAFRREEEFAAFLSPVLEKGFRFGKPAVFPNLLLSSPAGHASIYLGLRGPVFTTSDLTLSMGTALSSAADLIAAEEADVAIACTVVERDAIVEGALAPLTCGPDLLLPPHAPSVSALVLRALTSEPHNAAAPAPLALLTDWQDGTQLATWSPAPPPAEPALVLLPRPDAALQAALDRSPWSAARRVIVSHSAGSHEGSAGLALVAAVDALSRGEARAVLVLDHWQEPPAPAHAASIWPRPGRWAAFTLVAPPT